MGFPEEVSPDEEETKSRRSPDELPPLEAADYLFIIRHSYRWPLMAASSTDPRGAYYNGGDQILLKKTMPTVCTECNIPYEQLTPLQLITVTALDALAAATNEIIRKANKLTYEQLSENQIRRYIERIKRTQPDITFSEKTPIKSVPEPVRKMVLAEAQSDDLQEARANYRKCGEKLAEINYEIQDELDKWRRGGIL